MELDSIFKYKRKSKDMKTTNEKIDCVRQSMEKENIAAIIIPSNDPHQSEYVTEHWQARKWLTGFSGSAGVAVVTKDHANLWTDFRYYIQAENQISGSKFKLFKMGEPDVQTFQKWLCQTLKPGDRIGIDGNMFSLADVKKMKEKFENKGILLDPSVDIVKALWNDRPPRPETQAFSFSVEYAGRSRKDKIEELYGKMEEVNASYHLMATLDDIAWTLNLRGNDVHTNPVNISFLLIEPQKTTLFIPQEKVSEKLLKELKQDNIDLKGYEDIFKALEGLPDRETILLDPDHINYKLYQSINKKCTIIEKQNPAIGMKAVKNEVEIAHLRQTAVKDGAAVINFLHWLEHEDEKITEVSAADTLLAFRKQQSLFVDNSFDPIMAFQDHSAMCHYSASPETDVVIGEQGMFLTDSGGNYLTGTTDITRTVFRGTPSKREITDYTLVLKGHIAVATAFFPKGTKGFQVDTLSRQYLWNQGMDFGHGTGHGVGFFLCVHEGPARISSHPLDVKLEKGMVLTNEPGVYRDGGYGIRLENMILVDQAFENEFGTFLKFENLTFCHFEKDLINTELLTQQEIDYINNYHKTVFEKVSPLLETKVTAWLGEKTKKLKK